MVNEPFIDVNDHDERCCCLYGARYLHIMCTCMLDTGASSLDFGYALSIDKGRHIFLGEKIVNIFLPISFNICFGCSKEPSHRDGSFEYPKHTF